MSLEIRAFDASEADYQALSNLQNAVFPSLSRTPGTLRSRDALQRPDLVNLRFMAEWDGQVVGYVTASQNELRLSQRAWYQNLLVLPEHQGEGIGQALYAHQMNMLEPYPVSLLFGNTQENQTRGSRFLHDRDWREHHRSWESHLSLERFDVQRFAGTLERVQAQGYRIVTFAELERQDRQGARRQLYEMDREATQDIPGEEDVELPPLERYWEREDAKTDADHALWFVALSSTGELAGISQLSPRADDTLDTGFTGVARAHRRKGVALALKLRAVQHALSVGARRIHTDNAQANRPMLEINEALGFEKQPAWIEFRLTLEGEARVVGG